MLWTSQLQFLQNVLLILEMKANLLLPQRSEKIPIAGLHIINYSFSESELLYTTGKNIWKARYCSWIMLVEFSKNWIIRKLWLFLKKELLATSMTRWTWMEHFMRCDQTSELIRIFFPFPPVVHVVLCTFSRAGISKLLWMPLSSWPVPKSFSKTSLNHCFLWLHKNFHKALNIYFSASRSTFLLHNSSTINHPALLVPCECMPFILVNSNPTILLTAAAFKYTLVSAGIYFLIILFYFRWGVLLFS